MVWNEECGGGMGGPGLQIGRCDLLWELLQESRMPGELNI